jgi:hypothetical protein
LCVEIIPWNVRTVYLTRREYDRLWQLHVCIMCPLF